MYESPYASMSFLFLSHFMAFLFPSINACSALFWTILYPISHALRMSLRVGCMRSRSSLNSCMRIGDFIIFRVRAANSKISLLGWSSLNQTPFLYAVFIAVYNFCLVIYDWFKLDHRRQIFYIVILF